MSSFWKFRVAQDATSLFFHVTYDMTSYHLASVALHATSKPNKTSPSLSLCKGRNRPLGLLRHILRDVKMPFFSTSRQLQK
ncbi:hypothetical protein TorRG33x02_172270 [Trema orientale]|uniref:Uncharacterized protein n=1 Tax=Trema orientale TaxID=63057 RepID=A0A2P5EN47_TREOI|nr:hypothetical protein TorRG33x02_172270 [Trema orientale]